MEGLGLRGGIVELNACGDIGSVRPNGHAHGALDTVHTLDLAHPGGLFSVRALLDRAFDGHEGGGAVVLRIVKFDAAGHPHAAQADQRWLDDVVLIDEVIIVDLVVPLVDAAAQFGQHRYADEVVFQPDRVVSLVLLDHGQLVAHPIGIDVSARTLIDAQIRKQRQFLRRALSVGGNDEFFAPNGSFHVNASCLCSGGFLCTSFFRIPMPLLQVNIRNRDFIYKMCRIVLPFFIL